MSNCHCSHKEEIARSDKVVVTRCKDCGRYWTATAEGYWPVTEAEAPLCEMIQALSRFVPKAVTS